MIQQIWNLLETELQSSGYPPEKINQEDWGTWWEFQNLRQRGVKKGEKGVRVSVKNLPCPVIRRGKPLTETDKKGNVRPMIRMRNFKKSFFHISQTELKGANTSTNTSEGETPSVEPEENVIPFPNKNGKGGA